MSNLAKQFHWTNENRYIFQQNLQISFFQVDDVEALREEQVKKKVGIAERCPPTLVIYLGENDNYLLSFVVCQDHVLRCNTDTVMDALIVLLATYYAFDLQYPQVYGQFLVFLQQHILEQPYTLSKGSNFQMFNTMIKNHK